MTRPALPELPDKLFFRIGEVSRLVGVKPHVLRYWEAEFPQIRPEKSEAQHRLYRRKDVETFREIRRLLHEQRFTVEGARRKLRETSGAPAASAAAAEALLDEVRRELIAILALLAEPAPPLVIGPRDDD